MGTETNSSQPEKIVILGGGVSSITAAFELTSQPDWQSKYDITLYQQGWRIGGKGASGRNAQDHERIEEHGIHVWFGFYYNAFHAMRACYKELARPADAPLATWNEAFKPHHTTAFAQDFNNDWLAWTIHTLALPGEVGEGWNPKSFMEAVAAIISWLLNHTKAGTDSEHVSHGFFHHIADDLKQLIDHSVIATVVEKLEEAEHKLLNFDQNDANAHPVLVALLKEIRTLVDDITKPFRKKHVAASRLWLLLDFGLTAVIGLIEGELYHYGLDSVNDTNLKDWMKQYGASEETLDGPIMHSLYGGIFAYKNGDTEQPNVETGTVLRAGMLAVTTAKESFIWRMQAGMGDVVFAPYYEVLKRRGVKFKFFHQVEELVAEQTKDRSFVKQICIAKQVPLAQGVSEYDPLVNVKGLPCWPSEPQYDQIEPSVVQQLKDNHINLESFWSNWSEIYNQEKITLEAGTDFDRIIFGISVASIPSLCPTLLTANPKLKEMTDNISTVCTQAYQLWMNQDIQQLGWPNYKAGEEAPEVLGYNTQALDSWADVSYLAERETWPADNMPKDISYFCGVFAPDAPPPTPNPAYPISQTARAKTQAITMLEGPIKFIMPNFTWDALIAPSSLEGEERFNTQYWRANIDPSERYVQSTVNTSKYRLATDESGFDNLLITGDWIRNGFNMGCVESATISGLQTARVIKGTNETIPGEAEFL